MFACVILYSSCNHRVHQSLRACKLQVLEEEGSGNHCSRCTADALLIWFQITAPNITANEKHNQIKQAVCINCSTQRASPYQGSEEFNDVPSHCENMMTILWDAYGINAGFYDCGHIHMYCRRITKSALSIFRTYVKEAENSCTFSC